ncbi:hypothetical protein P43SY_010076 [Pythium insidiosum]|uniref:Interferon-induced GTP-binding protein Mx n=1 Tax=Pythium insidiosum TaxID=114742 RepID=A0AAD5Q963_PYTIN|nr:hypothetical protein P43SY_010076 [Pythium insidiosum]
MGDTSSGKSSLLSALSGITFPSSDQLTTRCPAQLILSSGPFFRGNVRLHRFHANASEFQEDIASMDDVPHAIQKLTQVLVDEGQYISDDQIVLELSGPELPNVTLTDLPGLVRTVGDNEDASIIGRVRDMVQRFMSQERTIIIAVVPANVDMHNTEILQAAQEADPTGMRTIAVITKMDLVDAGAEPAVHELLLNKKKHMQLGYHAVKCRSQKDLNDGMTINDGLRREEQFFKAHEYWRRLPANLWGISRLSSRLTTILQDNIRRTLPTVVVVGEISELMDKASTELQSLGMPTDTPAARRQAFLQWVHTFLRYMKAAADGEYEVLPKQNGAGGPDLRLRAVLRKHETEFMLALDKTKQVIPGVGSIKRPDEVREGDAVEVSVDDKWQAAKVEGVRGSDIICSVHRSEWLGPNRWRYPKSGKDDVSLSEFIKLNRGDELAVFPSYRGFCNIFRRWVDQWEAPLEELLRQYRVKTLDVSSRLVEATGAIHRVEQFIKDSAQEIMRDVSDAARKELMDLLDSERRPYTQDGRLFEALDRMRQEILKRRVDEYVANGGDGDLMAAMSALLLSNECREEEEMKSSLRAYVEVAVARVNDVIPMRTNARLVAVFLDRLESQLMMTTDERLERLLQEPPHMQQRREELEKEVMTLRAAKEITESFY